VIADYDAQTAVERELVLRLASVLWRLRRTAGRRPNFSKDCRGTGILPHATRLRTIKTSGFVPAFASWPAADRLRPCWHDYQLLINMKGGPVIAGRITYAGPIRGGTNQG
jgi:hypothetical protein